MLSVGRGEETEGVDPSKYRLETSPILRHFEKRGALTRIDLDSPDAVDSAIAKLNEQFNAESRAQVDAIRLAESTEKEAARIKAAELAAENDLGEEGDDAEVEEDE